MWSIREAQNARLTVRRESLRTFNEAILDTLRNLGDKQPLPYMNSSHFMGLHNAFLKGVIGAVSDSAEEALYGAKSLHHIAVDSNCEAWNYRAPEEPKKSVFV